MNAVETASQQLRDALAGVSGVRLQRDIGPAVDPPATVLGPPTLTWDGLCAGPTGARFVVWVIAAPGERAIERLGDMVLRVAEAVDAVGDAVVVRADPAVYPAGSTDLPAYQIQVDYAL